MRSTRALLLAALLSPALAAPSEAVVNPPPDARWQYQLEPAPAASAAPGRVAVGICATPWTGGSCVKPTVIDFDLYYDEPAKGVDDRPNRPAVDALHARGGYAICYVDAGSIESYRPDYRRFVRWHRRHSRTLLGKPFSRRFPDERWANVGGPRQRAFLLAQMRRRTRLCARAGFDAVEYDVVNAWEEGRRTTGWRVSFGDQIAYNRGLARIAHRLGLAAGLKNDLGQARRLEPSFDFAINEECFAYRECGRLKPFVRAGKPVYSVEYGSAPGSFCGRAAGLGFNAIAKAADFSLRPRPWVPCE